MRRIRPFGFIAGFVAAIVLTGGGVAAYAANGGSLLIGRSNTGSTITTLTNTRGTPLSLRASSSSYAPFLVNSSKVVANLNADKLDGLSSANYVQRTGAAAASTGNIFGVSAWAPSDPNDPTSPPDPTTDTIISVADCPTGTKLTGGGSYDGTDTGITYGSFPDANSWVVITLVDSVHGTGDVPVNVESYAVCYNPRGLVTGGQPNARVAAAEVSLSPASRTKLARVVAKVNR
jgi:hypothetical protein